MAESNSNVMKSPFSHMVIRNLNMQLLATLITFIPFLLSVAFLTLEASALVTSLVGCIIYFVLIYNMNWATAERDRNLVLYGHMPEDKQRGLRAGIYAVIPLAVLTLVLIVFSYAGALPAWYQVLYKVLFLPFVVVTNWVITGTPLVFAGILVCALCPLAAWLGYHNGYNLIQIMPKVLYKQKPRPKDKRMR